MSRDLASPTTRTEEQSLSISEDAHAGNVVIIGAGPAGLTAAYQLAKAGRTSTVLEGDGVVGGISRTVERDGWRFDIGGHRFFTKVQPVEDLWHEILEPDEILLRPRSSRIYYRGRFYDYPLKPLNALRNLGLIEAMRCVASYLWVRVRPPRDRSSLEGYIAAKYGWRLYQHFFKTYNEKVWGVPASQISADWGAQRIKGMSLWDAVWEPIRSRLAGARKERSKQVTSLIEQFQYPKYGPGMMWERCAELVEAAGSKIIFGSPVTGIRHEGGVATRVVANTNGATTGYPADDVISSMPLPDMIRVMDPPVPPPVRRAADDLGFRDFLSVALVVPAEKVPWTDNWIYIHAPEVKTMRVQNFGSWSPFMVKDGRNVLGLEYTVSEGDDWWTAPDEELLARGKAELEAIGLMKAADVEAGYVVRMPKAYPIYDPAYKANVDVLREWLGANASNVLPVGRNGMHKYNNQDHSMYTAMLSVENLLGADHDVWSVNVEEDYHEEKRPAGGDGRAGAGNSGGVGSGGTANGRSGRAGTGSGTGRDAPILPSRIRSS
jgi:protoporphyrinogen oxidase